MFIISDASPTFTVDGIAYASAQVPFATTRALMFRRHDWGDFVERGGVASGFGAATFIRIFEVVDRNASKNIR